MFKFSNVTHLATLHYLPDNIDQSSSTISLRFDSRSGLGPRFLFGIASMKQSNLAGLYDSSDQ